MLAHTTQHSPWSFQAMEYLRKENKSWWSHWHVPVDQDGTGARCCIARVCGSNRKAEITVGPSHILPCSWWHTSNAVLCREAHALPTILKASWKRETQKWRRYGNPLISHNLLSMYKSNMQEKSKF
jgi:hypothetical protein